MKVNTFIKDVVRTKRGLILYGKKNTGLEATRIDGRDLFHLDDRHTLLLPPDRLPRKWKKTINKRIPKNN